MYIQDTGVPTYITNNTVSNNTGGDAGGIKARGYVTISQNEVTGNSGYAGGIFAIASAGDTVVISDNLIKGNSGRHGGIYLVTAVNVTATVSENKIISNSGTQGGGIYGLSGGSGSLTIQNNILHANSVSGSQNSVPAHGAALWLEARGNNLSVTGNSITGHSGNSLILISCHDFGQWADNCTRDSGGITLPVCTIHQQQQHAE